MLDPCKELERRGWTRDLSRAGRGGVLDPARGGGGAAAGYGAGVHHARQQRDRRDAGCRRDCGACARERGSARLHVDAAQSVGKCAVDFAALGIDLLSLSAHKSYGPKGSGPCSCLGGAALQLKPILYGGGQERGLRSGTVATHQVVGMGAALRARERCAARELSASRRWASGCGTRLACHGRRASQRRPRQRAVPHLLNVSFEGVEGESLLAAVRPCLAVSTGSACTSATQEPSYVLRALGRDDRLAESSLRFSFGRFTSEADIDAAAAVVTRAVERLRRIAGCRSAGPRSAGS